MRPDVTTFFHRPTFTCTHVVADPASGRCAIIDPALDFDAKAGRTATDAADQIIAHIRDHGLILEWILETHAHADHLTASPYFKENLGGRSGIGARVTEVQSIFKALFNAEPDFATDGRQFDHLFANGERFAIGELTGQALHTPGHTPACVTYVIGDAAFVGDTVFMPDSGTGRADFPGGDPAALYDSLKRILALPPETRLFMCHDYGPDGREYAWQTTVAEERADNIHIRDGVTQDEYVRLRTERDRTLDMPTLILPSVQVNMRAGHFPPPEENGITYLKLPINAV